MYVYLFRSSGYAIIIITSTIVFITHIKIHLHDKNKARKPLILVPRMTKALNINFFLSINIFAFNRSNRMYVYQ